MLEQKVQLGSAGHLNLPNLPLPKFRRQSNTNSESNKSTVFRIATDQTNAKIFQLFGYQLNLDLV